MDGRTPRAAKRLTVLELQPSRRDTSPHVSSSGALGDLKNVASLTPRVSAAAGLAPGSRLTTRAALPQDERVEEPPDEELTLGIGDGLRLPLADVQVAIGNVARVTLDRIPEESQRDTQEALARVLDNWL